MIVVFNRHRSVAADLLSKKLSVFCLCLLTDYVFSASE